MFSIPDFILKPILTKIAKQAPAAVAAVMPVMKKMISDSMALTARRHGLNENETLGALVLENIPEFVSFVAFDKNTGQMTRIIERINVENLIQKQIENFNPNDLHKMAEDLKSLDGISVEKIVGELKMLSDGK